VSFDGAVFIFRKSTEESGMDDGGTLLRNIDSPVVQATTSTSASGSNAIHRKQISLRGDCLGKGNLFKTCHLPGLQQLPQADERPLTVSVTCLSRNCLTFSPGTVC
jgi:hypothetical protein